MSLDHTKHTVGHQKAMRRQMENALMLLTTMKRQPRLGAPGGGASPERQVTSGDMTGILTELQPLDGAEEGNKDQATIPGVPDAPPPAAEAAAVQQRQASAPSDSAVVSFASWTSLGTPSMA